MAGRGGANGPDGATDVSDTRTVPGGEAADEMTEETSVEGSECDGGVGAEDREEEQNRS